ncbi:hypothetical protein EVG20_g6454 [Dentipellis fragilis]|uniref:DUF292-domain-containing protein n=1 Tax=Dentipellis fragilis TaxID=205917 RepID=A0A4Y9YPY7_9AGAM|nr:hypothetical protein EVG20_g6454 [Dentipellis fragilis]
MAPWNPTKAKVQLRLSVQRLRTLQEKKEAQAKATRRDVATLLEKGKLETARIKVENSQSTPVLASFCVCHLSLVPPPPVINEDIYLELLELLELYCELLIARFGLLDQNTREPDAAVSEGVCAIIHAAPRTELKELHILRDLLMHKYGRDFSSAVMENRDGCVTERVVKKLVVDMPSSELVDAYLVEIAKAYNIQYQPLHKENGGGDEGGVKEGESEKSPVPEGAIAVGPGAEASDKSALKLPDLPPTEEEDGKKESSDASSNTKPASKSPPPKEDDFDVLAQRFAALKKR